MTDRLTLATRQDPRDLEQRLNVRIDLVAHRLITRLGALVVVVAGLLLAALHYIPPAHGAEAFDWDRYHARQDACLEQDRIAADCTRGYCDELALRQATRACSASGPLGRGETK